MTVPDELSMYSIFKSDVFCGKTEFEKDLVIPATNKLVTFIGKKKIKLYEPFVKTPKL